MFDKFSDALGEVMEHAKDVPVENIAAVGLTLIAGAAIAVKALKGEGNAVVDAIVEVKDAAFK